MRIVVIAVGTRGDVQPLIALAKGLRDAGHTLRVATTQEFATLVQEQGVEHCPLSGNPSQLMQDINMLTAMGGTRG